MKWVTAAVRQEWREANQAKNWTPATRCGDRVAEVFGCVEPEFDWFLCVVAGRFLV